MELYATPVTSESKDLVFDPYSWVPHDPDLKRLAQLCDTWFGWRQDSMLLPKFRKHIWEGVCIWGLIKVLRFSLYYVKLTAFQDFSMTDHLAEYFSSNTGACTSRVFTLSTILGVQRYSQPRDSYSISISANIFERQIIPAAELPSPYIFRIWIPRAIFKIHFSVRIRDFHKEHPRAKQVLINKTENVLVKLFYSLLTQRTNSQ